MVYEYSNICVDKAREKAKRGHILVVPEAEDENGDVGGYRVYFPDGSVELCGGGHEVSVATETFMRKLRETAFTAPATNSGEEVMFCSGLGFTIPLDEAWEIARDWGCHIIVIDGIDGKTVESKIPGNKFIIDGCSEEKVREILAGL